MESNKPIMGTVETLQAEKLHLQDKVRRLENKMLNLENKALRAEQRALKAERDAMIFAKERDALLEEKAATQGSMRELFEHVTPPKSVNIDQRTSK
ncbi:MAG: hypothetical protein ACYDA8_10990 [Deferrisomatales bacterium]